MPSCGRSYHRVLAHAGAVGYALGPFVTNVIADRRTVAHAESAPAEVDAFRAAVALLTHRLSTAGLAGLFHVRCPVACALGEL
ncbi:hypothetical protein GCM10010272_53460 [Streptomyces lateritius]|nr:hypothetical protein GCM10010272_53460 [Streptomyces lateritius]